MPTRPGLLALTLASFVLFAPAPAGAAAPPGAGLESGSTHSNARFGFAFKPPRGWENIALKTDEAWLAAKYLSDKTYFWTDPDTKWTSEHKPELMVIAFIKENMKREKQETEETEDGVTTKTITINNPYKDYEDFLDRTYSGGGFYVDEKEEEKLGDVDVTKYTIKVDKLSRNGPKRITTWIYHAPDIDFAMQIEVLEGEYKKLKRTVDSALGSFALIPRTEGDLPTSGKTEDGIWITIREMDEGPPADRRTKRMESQKQLQERAIRQLPSDWEHYDVDGILVLSHTDQKYALRVGKHAKLFLKWLDDTFPYIGKGEYVRQPIVRVCGSEEEERSFSRGVRGGEGWYFSSGDEITTHKSDEGFIGWEMDWVNQRLFDHWLQDRDRDLASALPEWLRAGLYEYVKGARSDGSKLDFRVDDWNRDETRVAIAQGRASSPRQLVQMTRSEIYSSSANVFWGYQRQSGMLVRFLMSSDARRVKQAKSLVEDYIKALQQVIEERSKKENNDIKTEKKATTEEEEQAQAKARAENWRKAEEDLLKQVYGLVFGGWSGSDWDKLEKGYFDFAG